MRVIGSAIALWLVVGCTGADGDESARTAQLAEGASAEDARDPRDEAGATRASRELRQVRQAQTELPTVAASALGTSPSGATAPDPHAPDPLTPIGSGVTPPGASPRARMTLRTTIDATEGENGEGAVVPAHRPIAFDVDAHLAPPGARDPVLTVGALRFREYTHPRPGVLRFVVADRALLTPGAEVAVQYGDDIDTRVVLARSLEVPR